MPAQQTHHTQKRHVLTYLPGLGGSRVSGEAPNRRHDCRVGSSKSGVTPNMTLTSPPRSAPQAREGGVSDILSPLLLELRFNGWGAEVEALVTQERGKETLSTVSAIKKDRSVDNSFAGMSPMFACDPCVLLRSDRYA